MTIQCDPFTYNGTLIAAQTVVMSSLEIDGSNLVVTTRTANGNQSRITWSRY